MTDPLKFNLNDEEIFPVLHGIIKYLDGFTPKRELILYSHKKYNPKTFKQTRQDINKSIAIIKGSIGRIMADYRNYIDKLYKERDYLFAINLADNQRDYSIKTYNRYVIREVEGYCNYIQNGLEFTFYPHFKKPEIEELNIKQCFSFWFEKFGANEENVLAKNENEIEIQQPPIKWNGTPGEFGAIFNLLFDKGFIERIKDKKNMVRFLHSIFDVRNEKDEIVDAEYLYKCFNDKKRSYPEGQLTIPFSENYTKGKLKKPL